MEPVTLSLVALGAGLTCGAAGFFLGRRNAPVAMLSLPEPAPTGPSLRERALAKENKQIKALFGLSTTSIKQDVSLNEYVEQLLESMQEILSLKQTQATVILSPSGLISWGEQSAPKVRALASLAAGLKNTGVWHQHVLRAVLRLELGDVLTLFQAGSSQRPLTIGVWTRGREIPQEVSARLQYALNGNEVLEASPQSASVSPQKLASMNAPECLSAFTRKHLTQGLQLIVEPHASFELGSTNELSIKADMRQVARFIRGFASRHKDNVESLLLHTSSSHTGVHVLPDTLHVLSVTVPARDSYPFKDMSACLGKLSWELPSYLELHEPAVPEQSKPPEAHATR